MVVASPRENDRPVSGESASEPDDLSRDVYGVLGIPIDAVDLSAVVQRIGQAVVRDTPFLMSTPNLNFLVSSQTDPEFRESLLRSDLCPVDGVPDCVDLATYLEFQFVNGWPARISLTA